MNDKSRLDRDTTDSYDPNESQYFSYIFDSSDECLGRKLQQEAANDEPPPPMLVRQMEEKIKKEQKRLKSANMSKHYHGLRKIAAIFLITVSVTFSLCFITVDAFRLRVLNFIFVDRGNATEHGLREELNEIYMPAYIPSDFEVILYSDQHDPIQILLQNTDESKFANIYISTNVSKVMSDTEALHQFESITVNGTTGKFTEKDGRIILVWTNTEKTHIASINTNVTKNEALSIAESINLN